MSTRVNSGSCVPSTPTKVSLQGIGWPVLASRTSKDTPPSATSLGGGAGGATTVAPTIAPMPSAYQIAMTRNRVRPRFMRGRYYDDFGASGRSERSEPGLSDGVASAGLAGGGDFGGAAATRSGSTALVSAIGQPLASRFGPPCP